MTKRPDLSLAQFEHFLDLPVDQAVLARYIGITQALYRYLQEHGGLTEELFIRYYEAVKQEALDTTPPSQAKAIHTIVRNYHERSQP